MTSDANDLTSPLSLPMGPCWELEERRVDSTTFFRLLASAFTEATTAYFEGSSIAPDVAEILDQHADPGEYLPRPQTLLSMTLRPQRLDPNAPFFITLEPGKLVPNVILRLRCLFTPALCDALASASLHHAEPELFDHLFLYADRVPLLEWPDAFSNCMWIASSIPESRVRAFAAGLGVGYTHEDPGQ